MRVAVVQLAADLDPVVNRVRVDDRLAALEPGDDLVVLPEASAADFGSPDHNLEAVAEPLDGPFVSLLAGHARRLGATVVAGMFERRDGALPFNTVVAVGPDGSLRASYRKIHLYDSFGYRESERLSAGDIAPTTLDVAGTRIGLMTCYDLRFPELARLLVDDGAEALVVPSAWVAGDGKLAHWRTLLGARAIENTVDVVAAAQGGPRYTGHSVVLDALGSIVVEAEGTGDRTITAHVDPARRARARELNPSLAHRRITRRD